MLNMQIIIIFISVPHALCYSEHRTFYSFLRTKPQYWDSKKLYITGKILRCQPRVSEMTEMADFRGSHKSEVRFPPTTLLDYFNFNGVSLCEIQAILSQGIHR